MTTVTRRNVLKSGTALVGGMAGILATGRAPAFAQGTTVHWLRWNDFVPASDQLLRNEIAKEGEKALGIKLNFETVNANDLQPRITSAIQSGVRPRHHHASSTTSRRLYARERHRLSATSLRSSARPRAATTKHLVQVEPMTARNGSPCRGPSSARMIAYRKSWFDEIGSRMETSPRRGRSIARSARS